MIRAGDRGEPEDVSDRDQSATAVKAMRQACKNILYTVGNSGYYTINEQTGIDALTAAIVIIPLVLVFMNWKKKTA